MSFQAFLAAACLSSTIKCNDQIHSFHSAFQIQILVLSSHNIIYIYILYFSFQIMISYNNVSLPSFNSLTENQNYISRGFSEIYRTSNIIIMCM